MSGASVLELAWRDAQPRLNAINASLMSAPWVHGRMPRVGQLDAELLDQELLQVLKEPLLKSLDIIGSKWRTRLEPEMTFLVQAVLYKYSMWDSAASYGARLQNLRYRTVRQPLKSTASIRLPRTIVLVHASLTVLLPYLHTRLRSHGLSNGWPDAPSFTLKKRLWTLLNRLQSFHHLFGFLNFLSFLWNGRYRTLVDRLLGLRLYPVRPLVNRNVSYEFMNRQMVWHAFTEFLLFFLPIINTRRIRRNTRKAVEKMRELPIMPSFLRLTPTTDPTTGAVVRRGKFASLPEDQCAICAEDASSSSVLSMEAASSTPASQHPINLPYLASCGHIYCYTCISDRLLRAGDDGETSWECLRCELPVKGANRAGDGRGSGTFGEYDASTTDGFDLDELSSDHTFETMSTSAYSE